MRTIAKICIWISAMLLLLLAMVFAVDIVSADHAWVEREFDRIETPDTDMSAEDKARVFNRMLAYSRGEADSLDMTVTEFGKEVTMFNERELSHMVDVRVLLTSVLSLRWIFPLAMAALLAFAIAVLKRQSVRTLCKAYIVCLAMVALIVAVLGIWAAADFDSFWRVFHMVFLDLESSTFDVSESRMIRICTAELFFDMVVRFFVFAVVLAAIPAVAAGVYMAIRRRRQI